VLIANSGDFNMLFQGTSNIWIGKYNADGEIETEKTFTGTLSLPFVEVGRTLLPIC